MDVNLYESSPTNDFRGFSGLQSQAVRIAKIHFDMALGRLFQVKKRVEPPFVPPLAPAVLAIVNGDS